MFDFLFNLILIAWMAVASPALCNHAPIANDDQRIVLFQPAAIVDIAVLANDVDPDNDALRVVELSTVQGGKAEIVDGAVVRVYVDWSLVSGGALEYRVAHGTYLVSDGVAVREHRVDHSGQGGDARRQRRVAPCALGGLRGRQSRFDLRGLGQGERAIGAAVDRARDGEIPGHVR